MKTSEIRELSAAELAERIEAEKANLLRMKEVNHAVSPAENHPDQKGTKNIACMADDSPL